MEKNRLKIALGILAAMLITAAGIVAIIYIQSWKDSRQVQTYYLGDPGWTGYVGVILSYDQEPVDVTLLSPSGAAFGNPTNFFGNTRRTDIYQIDEEKKEITVLVDTQEPGGWSVRFPHLSNTEIQYRFVTRLSPTLYLAGGDRITEEDGKYYLTFTAILDAGTEDTCRYSVQLEQNQYSRLIASGDAPFNQETKVEIQPPVEKYDGTEYLIKLSVIAPPADGEDNKTRTAHTSFKVILNPGGI